MPLQRRLIDVFRQFGAQRDYPGSSFSVGFAALQADDLLGDLIARADAALYEAKRRRR